MSYTKGDLVFYSYYSQNEIYTFDYYCKKCVDCSFVYIRSPEGIKLEVREWDIKLATTKLGNILN